MKKNKWLTMKASEKTQWFYKQCEKYNLTTKVTYDDDLPIRIDVNELPVGDQAYFVVFLPRPFSLRGTGDDAWHLEIGGSYTTNKNGGIWYTEPTMEGMEDQIEKVIELHKIGY